ncbi:MAG: hypothetical protein H7Y36_00555 [Armatimonadetes bacterium]|nr:hypothetical protein [Akkermansiaceae bacterium]
MRIIQIFVSSPGDVSAERQIAGRIIGRLQGKYWSFVRLDDVFWEEQPVRSTDHYQAELVNPAECEIVLGILGSRLGSPLPAKFLKQSGERYQSGTEWELEAAFDGYERSLAVTGDRFLAKPDILIYRCRKPRLPEPDPESEKKASEQEALLNAYITRQYYNEDGTIRRPISRYSDLDEFEAKLSAHLEGLILRLIPALRPGFDPPPISGSPFKGLQSFDFQDSDRYFGRNRDIKNIQDQLRLLAEKNSPFLLIYGGSGYGKSSLMRAGLAPVLTRPGGSLDTIEGWRRVDFQPAKGTGSLLHRFASCLLQSPRDEEIENARLHPHWPLPGLTELESAISRSLAQDSPWVPADLLADNFSSEDHRAEGVAGVVQILEFLDRHLLLQIDQLEEIFITPEFSPEQVASFLRTIAGLIASGRVWTVATMRNEYFSRLAEDQELRHLVGKDGGYILGPPTYQSLREMIRYPVLAARLDFQSHSGEFSSGSAGPEFEELDEQILADAASSADALPLLEFTLQQLYDDRSSHWLTWNSYLKIGGLKGSIASRAEIVYRDLSDAAKEARHWIFTALVRLDPLDHSVSRQRASLETLYSFPGAPMFINAFQQAHLLVTDEDRHTGQPVITLAHEALFTHWHLLAHWIVEFRGRILARQRLYEQALLWMENGRKKSHLLGQGALASAEEVAASGFFALSRDEQRFLELSRARRRAGRWVVIGTVAALVCLSGIAWQLTKRAAGSETIAEANNLRANAERAGREAKEKEAIAEGDRADTQNYFNRIADAKAALDGERLTQAREFLDSAPEGKRNWEWGCLDAQLDTSALTLAHEENHEENKIGFVDAVNSACFSPDGTLLVTGGNDGAARIWNVATGEPQFALMHPVREGARYAMVSNVSFSPDGSSILTSSDMIRIWDFKTRKELVRFQGGSGAKFDPTGRYVLSVNSEKKNATVWNAKTGRRNPEKTTATVWNAKTGSQVSVCHPTEGEIQNAQFSPDGNRLLTHGDGGGRSDYDDAVRVWEVATGKQIAVLRWEKGRPGQAKLDQEEQERRQRDANPFEYGRLHPGSMDPKIGSDGKPLTPPELLKYPKPESDDQVTAAVFDPTGSRILVTVNRGSMIWAANGAGEPLMLKDSSRNKFAGSGAAWSRDGNRVAIGAIVWDAATGNLIRNYGEGYSDPEFSPDGERLLTTTSGLCRIWNLAKKSDTAELAVLRGHRDYVNSAHFSPDGSKVATASKDNSAKIWDGLRDGAKRFISRGWGHETEAPQFSPDGKKLLYWVSNGISPPAKLGSMDLEREKGGFEIPISGEFQGFVVSPDSSRFIMVAESVGRGNLFGDNGILGHGNLFGGNGISAGQSDKTGSLELRNLNDGKLISKLERSPYRFFRAWFTPDGRKVIGLGMHFIPQNGGKGSEVGFGVWDATTGKLMPHLESPPSPGDAYLASVDPQNATVILPLVHFSPDSSKIAIRLPDRTVGLWDLSTGKRMQGTSRVDSVIRDVQFSPSGDQIMVVSEKPEITFWSTLNGAAMQKLKFSEGERLSKAGYMPDPNLCFTFSFGNFCIWDTVSGIQRYKLNVSAFPVSNGGIGFSSMAITKDGRNVHLEASGAHRLVDWKKNEISAPFGNVQNALGNTALFISGDSRLITGSELNGGFDVWDPTEAKQIISFPGKPAAFSADGKRALIRDKSGSWFLWESVPYSIRHRYSVSK